MPWLIESVDGRGVVLMLMYYTCCQCGGGVCGREEVKGFILEASPSYLCIYLFISEKKNCVFFFNA